MKNLEIARVFNDIADILEIKGDNPFRIRAYRRAAQNIEGFAKDVAETPPDELKKIPGIGQDLAEKIREYTGTGRLEAYEELKKAVPPGLVSLLSIPGIGPRTAKMLFEKSKIKNIDDLERLAKKGKLRELHGIQAKTEEHILKGIAMIKRRAGRYPLGTVLPLAEDILTRLEKTAPVKDLYLAGSHSLDEIVDAARGLKTTGTSPLLTTQKALLSREDWA
ncbi:DNA polymerase/3'-5' exonuclease PolX [bacterium BMS3Abin10]|nr:DNA polymerase/3'-5' exonuclease PolX [bacterium BMS3Abin10]GBE39270.1 DNA polymerase/3'-5' exonuclease PolX [bacterium BMS3Bbin08]